MVDLGGKSEMLVWDAGESGLEAGMAECLANTSHAQARWHALLRSGAAACWAQKPDLAYCKWCGRWQSTAVALQYATRWKDPAVIAPTVIPVRSDSKESAHCFSFSVHTSGPVRCLIVRWLR